MNNVDANKIGFIVLMCGIVTTTLGHYLPEGIWIISYGISGLFALTTAAIFTETFK